MPLNLDDVLVVAITSRALFDLHESPRSTTKRGWMRTAPTSFSARTSH
jgi:hypothetical protein